MHKCRQKCKGKGRGWPRQRRNCGGRPAEGRPPPTISFLLCSSSARGPLDISDISYGDPLKIIINFSNANANPNANANAKVLLNLFLQQKESAEISMISLNEGCGYGWKNRLNNTLALALALGLALDKKHLWISVWNANRNVKGTPGRGWAQQKRNGGGGLRSPPPFL